MTHSSCSRQGATRLKLILLLIAVIVCASCRSAPPQVKEELQQAAKFEAPENSGRRLAGEYVWQPAEDDYGKSGMVMRFEIKFDEGGNFKRRQAGGQSGVEEGAYIISAGSELVLFIEKIGEDQLEYARVERYLITEQADARLKLQADRAGSFILEKGK